MLLHELYPFDEERKNRKRIGRGSGSGWGKTSGRGHNGQNSRSGGGVRPGFEGGQMPLARRLPKRGFKNTLFRVEYEVINLEKLTAIFPNVTKITLEDIYLRGLAKKNMPVKILGMGEAPKGVQIEAHKFSTSAIEKIQKAGGEAQALEKK